MEEVLVGLGESAELRERLSVEEREAERRRAERQAEGLGLFPELAGIFAATSCLLDGLSSFTGVAASPAQIAEILLSQLSPATRLKIARPGDGGSGRRDYEGGDLVVLRVDPQAALQMARVDEVRALKALGDTLRVTFIGESEDGESRDGQFDVPASCVFGRVV